MRKVAGKSLYSWESCYSQEFPLADIIGRVAIGIQEALDVGIKPMVEHSGNVMVECSPLVLSVALIDIDGSHKLDDAKTPPRTYLDQLGSIFMNFDRHEDFSSFFIEERGTIQLCPSMQDVNDIIQRCRDRGCSLELRPRAPGQHAAVYGSEPLDLDPTPPSPVGDADDALDELLAEGPPGDEISTDPPADASKQNADAAAGNVAEVEEGGAETPAAVNYVEVTRACEQQSSTPMPPLPLGTWNDQPKLVAATRISATAALDEFVRTHPFPTRSELLLAYVVAIPVGRPLSQLVRAEMAYLYHHGDERPLLFEGDTDTWCIHDLRWRSVKGSLTRVKSIFQSAFLRVIREVVASARHQQTFPADNDGNNHPRMEFLEKTEACLECRESVEKLIRESAIFFDRDADFDANPWLFQCANCTLDLRTNTFRRSRPSDMCRRSSPITIPEEWLADPSMIDVEAAPLRRDSWETLWSFFKRDGAPHPEDNFDILGDQDTANFLYYMRVKAKQLEGNPLAFCLFLYSRRGRNGKGVTEKCYQSVWGDYYTPVKSTVFNTDKRDENEHNAAVVARKGARVGFGNETLEQPWCNATFKNRNSTDPIIARGCGSGDTLRYANTLSFVFGMNDPPRWEHPPKGSEENRMKVIYLPNQYIDEGCAPTSPR
jgi:hypothetical protein